MSADPDLAYLRKMVLDVLEASRVKPGTNGPKGWPITNTCGFSLVTPGKGGYPAFWVRDFTMATETGLVPNQEIKDHLLLIAKCQNGPETRKLKSGGEIPPFSIPDHINFDGSAVFYPGTYSSGEDQGAVPWGPLPPVDDHYEFIHLAQNLKRQSGRDSFLREPVAGMPLLDQLRKAFEAPETDPGTELVRTREQRRAVGFGFCDAVVLTGSLLFASLLRYRAAGELYGFTGDALYLRIQSGIARNVPLWFQEERTGWLLASTGIGRQPDVWGTLFALRTLPKGAAWRSAALDAVVKAYSEGTICLEAGVRHVPTDRDFSKSTMWESSVAGHNTYQNGAYWHTPTGWLFELFAEGRRSKDEGRRSRDSSAFDEATKSFFKHLRDNDYRLGKPGRDAPWECFGPNGAARQNGAYLASVALPYASLRRLQ